LANSTLELGARDAAVAEKIKMAQGKMERAYIRVIELGKTAGEIDPNKDAQTLARYIMACLAGIVCLSKSGYDAATLNDISVTAMQAVT
jgi:TetR/AcrR family transcriptional repressor of nem operon